MREGSVLAVLATLLASPAWAGAFAVGAGDLQRDSSSVFLFRGGTGETCVSVVADGVSGSGGGSGCTVSFLFGSITFPGLGTTGIKPGSGSYSDSASAAGTTSIGSASWAYISGTFFDDAFYRAETNIDPVPPTVRARARARADDPVQFDATTSGTLGLTFNLSELTLEATGDGSSAALYADYRFDNTRLFGFSLTAPAGFQTASDLGVSFTSILSPAQNAAILANLFSNLSLDPSQGRVSLSAPVALFPRTEVAFGPGAHELAGGLGTAVQAEPVPEPPAFWLAAAGLLMLGAGRLRGML